MTADHTPEAQRSLRVHPTTALNTLLLILIANFTLQPVTEPDFGWHLRMGLDMLKQNWTLPILDPYSHTMSDWVWIEHAWLTDVVIGAIYTGCGLLGVIGLFGVITAGAWILASLAAKSQAPFRLGACTLSLWVALPFLGARTQMVTLLGLAVLLLLLERFREGHRWVLWAIPSLFLLWANLHGGFTAGLFLLGLVVTMSSLVRVGCTRWPSLDNHIDERILPWSDLRRLMFATGAAAMLTLINPYGWKLYGEIFDSLSNQFMFDFLQEWRPVSLASYAGRSYAIYLAGLGVAMVLWYRRIEPVRWVVWAAFLMVSFRHLRNVPFFLIVSLPLCTELLDTAVNRFARWKELSLQQARLGLLGLTVAGGLFLFWLGYDHLEHVGRSGLQPEEYFRETSYPIEAIQWVHNHRDEVGQRLFNDYAHGGFLLWWLPGEKIFIDGRMPVWRFGDRWIVKDYAAVALTDPPQFTVFDQYGVDWAIVRHNTVLDRTLAQQATWTRIYEDAKVAIYVRAPG
jgi:hypothetical protein